MKFVFDEFGEGMRIAFTAIRANLMRSILTMLGIIIGIVSVTLMGTAIEGLNRAFNKSIAAIGADVLYIQKWPWGGGGDWWVIRNRKDLRLAQAKALEKQAQTVRAMTPITGTGRSVKYGQKIVENVVIIGTNAELTETIGANIAFGRYFSSIEADGGRPVCAIGSEVAVNLFPNETPIGKTIKIGGYAYKVIGVFEKQGSLLGMESLDNRVYIPINRFFKEFLNIRRSGIQMWIRAKSLAEINETKEEVRGLLRKIRNLKPKEEDDFAINQQEILVQTFNQIGGVIAAVGLFITGLSLFVGGIGIMNIMFVSVTERTKEIGIRKAIGAPRRTILMQFLLESAALCLLGGLIGIAIAFPISLIIDTVLPTAMPLSVVGIAILVSVFVGVVSGFLPAYRASRMDPVDALRYE